jgi:hypothetical protein
MFPAVVPSRRCTTLPLPVMIFLTGSNFLHHTHMQNSFLSQYPSMKKWIFSFLFIDALVYTSVFSYQYLTVRNELGLAAYIFPALYNLPASIIVGFIIPPSNNFMYYVITLTFYMFYHAMIGAFIGYNMREKAWSYGKIIPFSLTILVLITAVCVKIFIR